MRVDEAVALIRATSPASGVSLETRYGLSVRNAQWIGSNQTMDYYAHYQDQQSQCTQKISTRFWYTKL
jgi:hypothetical protein